MSIIYCHKNKITGKCYIGQTTGTLENRIGNNPSKSYRNNHEFSSDIMKYGWESFESFILETVEDNGILNERETYWINKIKETNEVYNKYLRGTNNAKHTPLVNNKISPSDIEIVKTLFDKEMSIREICQYVGLSILSIKKILINLGYKIPNVGNLDSFTRMQKEKRINFVTSIKCPVCGRNYPQSQDMRRFTCGAACQDIYKTLSQEQKNSVKKIVSRNHYLYKVFMQELEENRQKHREHVDSAIQKTKQERTTSVVDMINSRKELNKPKHTAEELYWHKDEVRCKQKLNLILNSGVDLMKFGYNTKLCKMFPELNKGVILFLLRKYNIPHFERFGSKNHIAM